MATSTTSSRKQATTNIPEELPEFITVINGFHGKLVYECKRTGELFIWENFGDEQDIELKELKIAKGSHKDFFVNNWFMFSKEDDWVLDYLGVRKLYSNLYSLDNFDNIFSGTPSEIKSNIEKLSDGQRESVAYRARELVVDGTIDSMKIINALEECLGIELNIKS